MEAYEAKIARIRERAERAAAAKVTAAKATPLAVGERVRLTSGKYVTIVEAVPTRMRVVVERTEKSGLTKTVGVSRLEIVKVVEAVEAAVVAALAF